MKYIKVKIEGETPLLLNAFTDHEAEAGAAKPMHGVGQRVTPRGRWGNAGLGNVWLGMDILQGGDGQGYAGYGNAPRSMARQGGKARQ